MYVCGLFPLHKPLKKWKQSEISANLSKESMKMFSDTQI